MKVVPKENFDWLFDRCAGIWSPVVSGNTGVTVFDLNPTTNYHGNLSGQTAAEAWAGSDIGNVLAFDGTNDAITISTDAVLTTYPFTLTGWGYYPTTTPTTPAMLISLGISATQYFSIGYRLTTPQPGIFARNTTFVANSAFTATYTPRWVCITGVFVSATRRELWVDGRLMTTVTTSVPQLNVNSEIRLGSGFSTFWYPQPIAEAMIHTRAWTADEIARYAAAGPGSAFELFQPTRKRSRYQPPATTNNRRRQSRILCFPG